MRKILLVLAVLLAPLDVYGQAVQQSGSIVPNHVPAWVTNGVIADGGTASDSPISSLGVTNNGGNGICVSTGRSTAAGRQQLCLSASLNGAGVISLQNYGTATAQNLQFLINGTVVTIPTGGGTVPSITTPLISGALICASGTSGALVGCPAGSNGQIYVAQASAAPVLTTLSGDVLSISAGGSVTLSGVHGVTYPASPSIGTAPYVSSSNTVTYGQIPVTGGGTGAATFSAAGVLVGNGTSPVTAVTTPSIGLCLLSNGTGVTPSWGGCASGAGSAAGANTQVQFNNSSALAGSANLTWVSPALTIGVNATATGQLVLANGGALGTSITIQNNSATTAYNFNLPISAGSSGQPMISGGGGASAMQFGTLGIVGGGTNCAAASGTCLDNITGFSGAGFINRTGAGSYSFTAQIGLANGGTGANLTASNGGLVYSTASAMAILSGTATANQIPLSGSNAAPAWSTATYPATTTVNQLLYSGTGNVISGLSTANNGVLITSSGGVPSIGSTLPAAVQANITATGTIATGTWQGSIIALAYGGTNANLTASNGGIHYSTASATAILSGTATASLPLLSGSSAAPTWATITYPSSGTSGGIAYFSSNTAMASSGLLTANQIMIGGGSGAAPTTFACATTTTVVHGGTPPTCSQIVNADITAATITNSSLAVAADSTIKSNISGGSASPSDNTITAVLDKQFGTTQGTVIYRNSTVWAALTPGSSGQFLTTGGPAANVSWSSGGAGTGTVTSVTPGNGIVSSVTTSCSQTVITASGTISASECVNAQTGTSYAIVDGDRAKLITASNAAAQAYTIAQAGNSSAFQTGWFVDVSNLSTNPLGVVTITPTTSTINGAASLAVLQGQSVRLISDGTNYQATSLTGIRVVKKQIFTSSGTYTPSSGLAYAIIECVGAGGGGGGTGSSLSGVYGGGGGGGGSYSWVLSTAATIGASQTVTIGALGAGATPGNNSGSAGGDTSVGTLCIGKGGAGGSPGSSGGFGNSGAGGVAGTGDTTIPGPPGVPGVFSTTTTLILGAGMGGSSFFGPGGGYVINGGNSATNGVAPTGGFGGGGGGGYGNNTGSGAGGGSGTAGYIRITEYTSR